MMFTSHLRHGYTNKYVFRSREEVTINSEWEMFLWQEQINYFRI